MRGCKARSLCVDIVVLQYQAQLEECHLIGIFSMMEDERERERGREEHQTIGKDEKGI